MPAEVAFRGGRTHPRSKAARDLVYTQPGPTEEQIRQRAYEIYQRRGGQGGRDLDDWLEAERELRREERSA